MDKKFFHEFIERGLVKNNRDNTPKARHEEMPLPEKPYNPQAPIIKLTDPDILENPDVGFWNWLNAGVQLEAIPMNLSP